MRHIPEPILIFSVFEPAKTQEENIDAHVETMALLRKRGIPLTEISGKCKGVKELSILIEGFQHLDAVEKMVGKYNQTCYLESHGDRFTSLVMADGTREAIGYFTACSKEEAEAADSFSFNPQSGYFITKPNRQLDSALM